MEPQVSQTNQKKSQQNDKSSENERDVILEVPQLKVNEINLKVEDLKAKISVQANVTNLVNIEVGADIFLEKVDVELKGVEAEAYLKVKLDKVQQILHKALESIDAHPDILKDLKGGNGNMNSSDQEEESKNLLQKIGGTVGNAIESAGEKLGSNKSQEEDSSENEEG